MITKTIFFSPISAILEFILCYNFAFNFFSAQLLSPIDMQSKFLFHFGAEGTRVDGGARSCSGGTGGLGGGACLGDIVGAGGVAFWLGAGACSGRTGGVGGGACLGGIGAAGGVACWLGTGFCSSGTGGIGGGACSGGSVEAEGVTCWRGTEVVGGGAPGGNCSESGGFACLGGTGGREDGDWMGDFASGEPVDPDVVDVVKVVEGDEAVDPEVGVDVGKVVVEGGEAVDPEVGVDVKGVVEVGEAVDPDIVDDVEDVVAVVVDVADGVCGTAAVVHVVGEAFVDVAGGICGTFVVVVVGETVVCIDAVEGTAVFVGLSCVLANDVADVGACW